MKEIDMIGRNVNMFGKIVYSKKNEDGSYNLRTKADIYQDEETDDIVGTIEAVINNALVSEDGNIAATEQVKIIYMPIEEE